MKAAWQSGGGGGPQGHNGRACTYAGYKYVRAAPPEDEHCWTKPSEVRDTPAVGQAGWGGGDRRG